MCTTYIQVKYQRTRPENSTRELEYSTYQYRYIVYCITCRGFDKTVTVDSRPQYGLREKTIGRFTICSNGAGFLSVPLSHTLIPCQRGAGAWWFHEQVAGTDLAKLLISAWSETTTVGGKFSAEHCKYDTSYNIMCNQSNV